MQGDVIGVASIKVGVVATGAGRHTVRGSTVGRWASIARPSVGHLSCRCQWHAALAGLAKSSFPLLAAETVNEQPAAGEFVGNPQIEIAAVAVHSRPSETRLRER